MDNGLKMFSINELAEFLNVSKKTIRRHIASGKIESTKVGGVHRISMNSIKLFLNLNKDAVQVDENINKEALRKALTIDAYEKNPFPFDSRVPEGKMEDKWSNHKKKINVEHWVQVNR